MRRMVALLVAALLLTGTAVAAEDVTAQTAEAIGADALLDGLPSGAASFLEGISPTNADSFGDGLQQIISGALLESSGAVQTALATMAVVLAVLVLCAVVQQLAVGHDATALVGALGITAACTGSLRSMMGLGQQTLEDVRAFATLLLPTMAAATAATGAVTSSTAIYVASVFFADLLMTAMDRVLLPLVYCYVAMATADAALGKGMLGSMGELTRSVVTTGLKGLLFVFTAYLSISGILSGNTDATTLRAAKLALSTAVPVVGGMLSDASETVLVSASLLRSSVGIFGMLAVLAICIVPFLRIGVQYLALKVTAAVGGVVGDGGLVKLVEALSTAMGMLLAMTGSSALLLLISCVFYMKAVTL